MSSSANRPDTNKELVVALFKNPDEARRAQKTIETWDQQSESVKLGGEAVVYKDPSTGKVKSERSGSLNWMRNASLGAYVGLIGGGKDTPLLGGLGNSLTSWLNGVDQQQTVQHVSAALGRGQAALAILCDDYEKQPLTAELQRLGAEVTGVKVPAETIAQTEAAIQTAASQGQVSPDTTSMTFSG